MGIPGMLAFTFQVIFSWDLKIHFLCHFLPSKRPSVLFSVATLNSTVLIIIPSPYPHTSQTPEILHEIVIPLLPLACSGSSQEKSLHLNYAHTSGTVDVL